MTIRITRRDFAAALAGGFLVSSKATAQTETPLLTRAIPGSGERIPVVGLGTAAVFDEDDETTRRKADAVVQALVKNGGRLIDTASTYGDAESVLGKVIATAGLRDKVFIATKLESPDTEELKRSLTRLKTEGITSTFRGDYPAVEAVLKREKPDFVQIDYSLDNRGAEKSILPLAAEVRAGVLTAVPYGNGRLFRAVRGKELPDWARGFANSWGQFFLKYLLADPRVTAVIPGTADAGHMADNAADAGHMADNAGAMRGPLPDPDQRRRMIEFVETL